MVVTRTQFPSKYIQGSGACKYLKNELPSEGSLFIVDRFVLEKLLPKLKKFWDGCKVEYETFDGECTENEIQRLYSIGNSKGVKAVVGFGGGKTLDTAKAVSSLLRVPIVIVPTLASTDAPCSARAVVYSDEGHVVRYYDLPMNPNVVLVDTEIIIDAPVRFLISGIGDALSTWFEAESCMKKRANNSTGAGDLPGSMTSYGLAKLCYDTLLQYGVDAVTACKAKAITPAFEKIVEANTLLSGLGFESGGLASCHAIHNGLSELEPCHKYFHGEKVAIGVLASLYLTDKSPEMIDEVFSFCQKVGLPICLADVGLSNVTEEQLSIIANRSCAADDTMPNETVTISPQDVIHALKALDYEGNRRRNK